MAIVEVKVPQLSESVAEATMLNWKKKAGEAVAIDEILIEIETDKVVLEVPAPAAGVLIEIVQGDGATVAAEQLIARIDTAAVAAVSGRAGSGRAWRPAGGWLSHALAGHQGGRAARKRGKAVRWPTGHPAPRQKAGRRGSGRRGEDSRRARPGR